MFTKKPERPERPFGSADGIRAGMAPSPSIGKAAASGPATSTSGDNMGPSVIGSDLVIMGNLESKGEVTVEGQIEGDIHCAMLLVGEMAQVTGGIVAEEVIVRGRVLGSIRGNKVTLQSSAYVEGDVFHRALAIEQGAFFEGKSRRSEDPMGSAQPLSNGNGLIGIDVNGPSGVLN
jgi:cytoskeletal protein CcmA (bactofilin family)